MVACWSFRRSLTGLRHTTKDLSQLNITWKSGFKRGLCTFFDIESIVGIGGVDGRLFCGNTLCAVLYCLQCGRRSFG